MKIVYVKENVVQEIIPEYALPVDKWYSAEFADKCVEAPDDVEQRWVYDPETGIFLAPPEPEPEIIPSSTEIISGTYIGTGSYGEANPNSIHPNIQAKVLMIFQNDKTLLTLSRTEATDKPFTWFASSAKEQCNENGINYNWIAIS